MLLAGILGAAIWAGTIYATGYEFGLMAWGIGLLVGGAALVSVGDAANASTGVLAVIVTLVSITLGKAMIVEIYVQEYMAESEMFDIDGEISRIETDVDYLVTFIADEIVWEYQTAGKPLKWPGGEEPEEFDSPDVYPDDVWMEAEDVWSGMDADEQETFRTETIERMRMGHEAGMALVGIGGRIAGFIGSFGLLDILFYLLAMGSAYKMGSGNGE
ncbi:hypothetical protein Pan265_21570 [Mucisphaera calidilacus]|uniref:Uncharacterized protein n=2 Tax=Mucisphaera calidilacus TaxID=2527982 RepID=A0A518BZ93_9BACT|nr:hypothetical protein Pan265_21570 [Mucisphaera calidilacus]